jgi:hypothetical protein
VKLPRNFSPIKVVQKVHRGNASFRKPPGAGWTGTVVRPGGGELLVEELATSWKVTDVYADSELEGTDLEQLLKDVLG